MGNNTKLTLSLLALLNLSACSSTQLISFSVIKESNQCQESDARISYLKTVDDQNRFIKNYSLFKLPDASQELRALFNQHSGTEKLFLIALGRQPTAGFGFNIQDTKGSLTNNILSLPITFTSPDPASMRAQMTTSPCLIVGVDSEVQYQRLIVDKLELSISK